MDQAAATAGHPRADARPASSLGDRTCAVAAQIATRVDVVDNRAERSVLYFFRRGPDAISCETRLHPNGPAFQLVITENARERVEDFDELAMLLSREHELLQAWRAQGWRDVGAPTPTPPDTWSGPR